jgi:anthranilate phosphoribosyltransferase
MRVSELRHYSSRSDVLRAFLGTRVPASAEAYFSILSDLRPDRLGLEDLAAIIGWIEMENSAPVIPYPHVNVFGTGGDQTVNLTSISISVASAFIPIIKVGTPGVTSRYGSYDFFKTLSRLSQLKADENAARLQLREGSRYIPLASIGFPYSIALRNARRRLYRQGIPDIYKIVFPFANYTNPAIQITGASSACYFNILVRLCKHFERTACVIYSEYNIDELMPGKNQYFTYLNSVANTGVLSYSDISEELLWSLFGERRTRLQSVNLLREVLTGRVHPVIKEVIVRNAALYVSCFNLARGEVNSLQNELNIHSNEIFGSLSNDVP